MPFSIATNSHSLNFKSEMGMHSSSVSLGEKIVMLEGKAPDSSWNALQ